MLKHDLTNAINDILSQISRHMIMAISVRLWYLQHTESLT